MERAPSYAIEGNLPEDMDDTLEVAEGEEAEEEGEPEETEEQMEEEMENGEEQEQEQGQEQEHDEEEDEEDYDYDEDEAEGAAYAIVANLQEDLDDALDVAEGEEEEEEEGEPEEIEEQEQEQMEEEMENEGEQEQANEVEEEEEEDYDYDYDEDEAEDEAEAEELAVGDGEDVNSFQKRIQQMYLRSPMLSPFLCNVCVDYVRNGVITICGHLFCWTCLWAAMHRRSQARCPFCKRRLLMHEDIMPFLGEGPNAEPNDSSILAQPGNVPRPSGMYLENDHYPTWFAVNGNEDTSSASERKLARVFRQMHTDYPRCMKSYKFLQWMQFIAALLIISWLTLIAF